ncbi:class A sortase [Ligilactobacillus murinus]|jgi:sortase A|uniref:Class A sortase n=1 Tax=Ligilactobacillus murinus TaxID=1622 RepID=A0AAE6WJP8_9LACO|nr:class A sortase [Ligilactobacillus murinus]HAB50469.1 class A sortase [Lactobacillus sp.]MCR1879925.1 class A sortase [Ligilactobacillus murinus]NEF81835.1 class A sortase [Ligilactobacillus murinus]NEF83962.1 class A sortase [Ligilactobacillus murinus]NEF86453.1 class A sortase [Ligilactobacillus murinus]
MRDFLKTTKGKVLVALTVLALFAASFGAFKLWSDAQKYTLMQSSVTAPATNKTTKATTKSEKIQRFSDDDLLKYRKEALAKGVDKYPNGYLEIPSINVKLPIYNRTNNLTLALGVGKDYYLDSQFGKGNVVLAGHNMERPGVLLSDLYKVRKGQEITLRDANDKEYRYKITSKSVQSAKVRVIDGEPVFGSAYYLPKEDQKPIVTVYTCADHGSDRLVVQGELVNE